MINRLRDATLLWLAWAAGVVDRSLCGGDWFDLSPDNARPTEAAAQRRAGVLVT